MTKGEIVSSHALFYHVTPKPNIETIDKEGLMGTNYEANDFADPKKARKQICFTTDIHLQSQLSAMRDKYNTEAVVYTVSGAILASKQFGLDYTHSGILHIQKKHTVEALRQMIDTYGTIACFEDLGRSEIEFLTT